MKPKNCLIFGASGQIGRHLIRKLTKNNYKVTAVTRNLHRKGYLLKTQASAGWIDCIEANIFDEKEQNEDYGSEASLSKRKPNPMINAMKKRQDAEIKKTQTASVICPKKLKERIANIFDEQEANKHEEFIKGNKDGLKKTKPMNKKAENKQFNKSRAEMGLGPLKSKLSKLKKKQKASKLKLKLAGLGDENMTYQDSKKVKIIKKKHPEVRKAKSGVEDILRGKGRSVDGSHSQSTFLSSVGDFIGGGVDNEPHRSQVGLLDDSELVNFQKDTGLIRVQNFPVNRSGDKKMSLGINSKVNSTQLKSIKDLETEGKTIGFSVGDLGKEVTGEGYRDLTKTLREQKFIG